MRLLILTLIVTVTFPAFGQRTIEGEVRLNDNTLLHGVNVIEKGTDNRVNSDAAGKFKIVCDSPNPTLEFSFIGLKTIAVTADQDYVTVYLEEDEEQLKEKTRLRIYPEYTSIGFNSGVNYTPIGLNIRNSLPTLFGLRMFTTTTIIYRTDLDANTYADIRLKRDRVISTGYLGRHFNLEFGYNKRKVTQNSDAWRNEEINVIPEFVFDLFVFRLGYGRQSFNEIETLKTNDGPIFGLGKHFKWYATIVGTAKKWNNYWQTEFKFIKGFQKNDFEFGVRFETLDTYRELDFLVLYRIHY